MIEAAIEVARADFALRAELRADAGRVVALLGPNGAGKTTVLQVLAGHVGLTGGRIAIAGEVVDEPARHAFVAPERRQVGYVHQDLLLFPHLTVRDNVAFGLVAQGHRRARARARADELTDAVGELDRQPALVGPIDHERRLHHQVTPHPASVSQVAHSR